MTSKEKNIAVYQSALSFLSEIIPDGMTKQDLENTMLATNLITTH